MQVRQSWSGSSKKLAFDTDDSLALRLVFSETHSKATPLRLALTAAARRFGLVDRTRTGEVLAMKLASAKVKGLAAAVSASKCKSQRSCYSCL